MLACEARPGRMRSHEPVLKTVVSVPQPSNGCSLGSDIHKYSPWKLLWMCAGLWQTLFAGGRVCFLHRRRKTWRALRSEVDARSLSSVHDRGALCYFPRKYLCVRLAVQKAPFYSLCPTWLLISVIDLVERDVGHLTNGGDESDGVNEYKSKSAPRWRAARFAEAKEGW